MNKKLLLQSLLVLNCIFSTVILTVKVNILPANNLSELEATVKLSQD